MDSLLRELERKAQVGDTEAQERLAAQRCRIDQHCWHTAPGMGYMSVYNSKFVCCNCGNEGTLTEDFCDADQKKCGPHAPTIEQGNWAFGQPGPEENPFKIIKRWRCNWRIQTK